MRLGDRVAWRHRGARLEGVVVQTTTRGFWVQQRGRSQLHRIRNSDPRVVRL